MEAKFHNLKKSIFQLFRQTHRNFYWERNFQPPLPSVHYVVKYIESWLFKRTINHGHTTHRTVCDDFQSSTQETRNQENPNLNTRITLKILENTHLEKIVFLNNVNNHKYNWTKNNVSYILYSILIKVLRSHVSLFQKSAFLSLKTLKMSKNG